MEGDGAAGGRVGAGGEVVGDAAGVRRDGLGGGASIGPGRSGGRQGQRHGIDDISKARGARDAGEEKLGRRVAAAHCMRWSWMKRM